MVGETVGEAHSVGHRHEHFARSLKGLSAVRAADVVHNQQIAMLPRRARAVGFVHVVDRLDDFCADRFAIAKAGIKWQPVLTVELDEVLAHLRVYGPLIEECDLIEPALLTGERVLHDGAAALPGAQRTVALPLELNRVGTTVTLDRLAVVGAEGFRDGCADIVVVVADEQPALSLKTVDEVGGQRIEDGWRVGHWCRTPIRRRNQTREQHETRLRVRGWARALRNSSGTLASPRMESHARRLPATVFQRVRTRSFLPFPITWIST